MSDAGRDEKVFDGAAVVAQDAAVPDTEAVAFQDDDAARRQRLGGFFDRLAALAVQPEAAHREVRALHEKDERVGVQKTVFNAVLNRPESI